LGALQIGHGPPPAGNFRAISALTLAVVVGRASGLAAGDGEVGRSSGAAPGRILVVDDHAPTREIVSAALEGAGFAVLACASGEEGLRQIAADPTIGLLITDIMMPGRLDGWRLAESGKALRHELRVIYISAVPTVVPTAQQGPGLGPLVPKPCPPKLLIASVERVFGLSPGPRQRAL
jgi:CheY-like chemotaxis protein